MVSLVGLGFGMGLVDGCAPAMLGQTSELSHDGTGIVYTLNTMAVQVGFVFGPVIGSIIMEKSGFWAMSVVLGCFMIVVSPVMCINRNVARDYELMMEKRKGEMVELKNSVL